MLLQRTWSPRPSRCSRRMALGERAAQQSDYASSVGSTLLSCDPCSLTASVSRVPLSWATLSGRSGRRSSGEFVVADESK
jgi:hypothetical protein